MWNLSNSSGNRKSTTKIDEMLFSLLCFWLLIWTRASLGSLLNWRFDLLFKKVEHCFGDLVFLHQLHKTLWSYSSEDLLLSAGYLIVGQHLNELHCWTSVHHWLHWIEFWIDWYSLCEDLFTQLKRTVFSMRNCKFCSFEFISDERDVNDHWNVKQLAAERVWKHACD